VSAPAPFDYAILRVVPCIERGEYVNAGVIVFCRTRRYLQARIELIPERVRALWPAADLDEIAEHLAVVPRVCAGGPAAGPIGQLPLHERFRWLVAPRSTVIQVSPVHAGLCVDPDEVLEHLVATMVRLPGWPAAPEGR
jgi:hypothetical protein